VWVQINLMIVVSFEIYEQSTEQTVAVAAFGRTDGGWMEGLINIQGQRPGGL
jgi:hypothetical protein